MIWANFHFLRPLWLILLPLVFFIYYLTKVSFVNSPWAKVIAPHLLPHLFIHKEKQKLSLLKACLLPMFMLFLILALSGPTIKKLPTNISFNQAPLIIGLEVSEPMLINDIEPSRLKRAIYKLEDLLKRYQGAEVSLIAFSGDAHLVVPFSDDYNTILSLAKTLTPDIMPKKGVYFDSLVSLIKDLTIRNAKARVVLMTSTDISEDRDRVVKLLNNIDVPITMWAFSSNTNEKLKNINNINTITFTPDSKDVDAIIMSLENAQKVMSKRELFFDSWYDLGPYCLAVAMVVLLICFFFARERLWLFSSLVLFLGTNDVKAYSFSDWFLRSDQQAERELLQGNPKKAALLFEDDFNKGSAYYRAKDYDKAISHLSKVNTSDGRYNLGNAYAHKGQIEEAIAAYDEALKLDPKNDDARANKELLEKLLKDQQQKQEQENQNQQENPSEQKEDQSNNESQKDSNDKKDGDQQANNNKASDTEKKNDQAKENKKEENNLSSPDKEESKEQVKKEQELKALPKEQSKMLDKETRYYLEPLGQNNSFYLKRKFLYESKNRESK